MCDGESKSIPLKNFYKFTHINKDVQNKLIKCTTVDSFV